MKAHYQAPTSVIADVLENINDVVLVIDHHDHIAFANSKSERIFHARVEDLVNKPFEKIFLPEDRDILVPNILKITKEKGEFEVRTMLRRPDDSTFLALLSTSFWPREEGDILLTAMHDLSPIKHLENMLRRSERMSFLGNLLDDLSHQIRNPVISIGGFAKRLSCSDIPKPHYAKAIVDEAARLEKLLDTLNSFLSLPKPRLQSVSIGDIIHNVEAEIGTLAKERGIGWRIECSDNMLRKTVFVDLHLFALALEAVVENACEAYDGLSTDKMIRFQAREPEKKSLMCAFEITDHGSGISAQNLGHVFDPFFSTKTGHIGMGLTFAHRIQKEQLGDISIKSAKGGGTSVTLLLSSERRRPIRIRKLTD